MLLKTERLDYREFRKEDFQLFYSIFSNEEIMKYAWIDKFNSEEEAKPFFQDFLNFDDQPNNNNAYAFAVISRDNGHFIGFADIQLNISNSHIGCGEIGYFLLPEFWGRGYATELAKAMIDFGFTTLKLHKICARCNANNFNSENVMRKAGMIQEGLLRRVRYKNSKWDDEKFYGILREEWKLQS